MLAAMVFVSIALLLSLFYFFNSPLPEKGVKEKITGLVVSTAASTKEHAFTSDAMDVLVWQGQYYTGTTFHQGTYWFNFTVYDAKEGGTLCWSNTVNLTTGVFGEWKTEQAGVGEACKNIQKHYFLEIKINNLTQGERRRVTHWNFLRRDTDETLTGTLSTDGIVLKGEKNIFIDAGTHLRNMTGGVIRFFHKPGIPNTRAITFDINSSGQENTSAMVMEYNPDGADLIRHFTETSLYRWDKNADLSIRDISARVIGSLIDRVTNLFAQDMDFNGTLQGSGSVNISGKIQTAGAIQGNYQSNDSSPGITDITGFWLCTDDKCKKTCLVQIKSGLITGCI